MINISHKSSTLRYAKAEGWLTMKESTVDLIRNGEVAKGDVPTACRIAGIEHAKQTSDLILFAHPIPLDHTEISTETSSKGLRVVAEVQSVWKTGVEVEAVTAVSGALLNALDMLKPHDSSLAIQDVRVVEKRGGTGDFEEVFDTELEAAVLVISDSTYAGDREDRSGKVIKEELKKHPVQTVTYDILPDDQDQIRDRVEHLIDEGCHLVITTGGTGFGPHDWTPEAVRPLIDKEAPGIVEQMRRYGSDRTPYAMLSREIAGISDDSLILTLPGSSNGARESMQALFPGVLHIFPMMWGGKHHPPENDKKETS